MAATGVTLSHQSSPLAIDLSENRISIPLQILIVAVAAIAAGALGFLVAGLAGLCVGAFVGGGLTAMSLSVYSPTTEAPESNQQLPEEPDLQNICPGPIADPAILWIVGTSSVFLAETLALHRSGQQTSEPVGPAFQLKAMAPEYSSLDNLTRVQKINPSAVIQELLNRKIVEDLEVKMKIAYRLPGDTEISDIDTWSNFLNTLHSSLRRLMNPIDHDRKNKLKDHIQNRLIPILASRETVLQELNRHPSNQAFVIQCREALLNPNGKKEKKLLSRLDDCRNCPMLPSLSSYFEAEPGLSFNEMERDLIDHPCPLIFASTTVDDVKPWVDTPDRLYVNPDNLRFGEDLQYVYTTAPNIERIRNALEPLNIEVRNLTTLAPAIAV